MRGLLAVGLVGLLVGTATAAPDDAPWHRRRRPDVTPNRISAARVAPSDWPAEPDSPSSVDRERLAGAIEKLCGWMPQGRPERYAKWVIKYAGEFDVDPFLLGSLIHRMGRCQPDAEALSGFGLTLIPPKMHWRYFDDGGYTYWTHEDGEWTRHTKELDRFPYNRVRLKQAEENLYFAAGLLSTWRAQHEGVDAAFEQTAHRHYISHFIWGDRVISDRAEDRVMLDRRRLLLYYGAIDRQDPVQRRGLTLSSPLDGGPRVVSSFVGDSREGGERNHRGIDLEADFREPVRTIADGKVVFAGVDLPGNRSHRNLTPKEIEKLDRELGAGGKYICVLHEPDGEDWLRSCYMHLQDVEVRYGEQVERGDRIGTIGRTGMDESAPHLHFELQTPDGILDPSKVLRGFVVGEPVDPEEVL
jgi:murein DD-endopeptidase MepM/ murein hydrolase activator NlpD